MSDRRTYLDMADIKVFVAAAVIVFVKADDSGNSFQDCVPSHWRSIAFGLAIVLVVIAIITFVKGCLPRCIYAKGTGSINREESQISIISSKQLMSVSVQNGKEDVASKIGGNFGKRDSKRLSLDMNLIQKEQERSPSISFEPATPSRESSPGEALPGSTEWVPSSPPLPPSETHLWVPSTARRRSVSLRGDSDEEKDVCSYCGRSIYQSHSANNSPLGSMSLERKRSVTFNQCVEEIHVLSNEPKKTRSRSPSLLLSGPFYAR